MLTAIKKAFIDPFSGDTPALSVSAMDGALKGKQLLRGRTAARVETLTSDLDAARSTVAGLESRIGEAFSEDLETAALSTELKEAENRVRLLEVALATALEKDRAAQAQLENAQRELEISAEEAALSTLKNVGLTFDHMLVELEDFLNHQLVPTLDACRAVSGPGHQQAFLNDATQGVELYLLRAARVFVQRGRAIATRMGDKKFSDRLPDATYARERRML